MKNKKWIVAIAVILAALVAAGVILYQKETLKTEQAEDGAEIEIDEDATGFACSCGCSSGNEMEDCQCEKCAEHKAEEEEETEEVYYKDSETGEIKAIELSETSVKPMDEQTVKALEDQISSTDTFCVRRCESMIIDNGGDEPDFTAVSESRYFYDAKTNRVLNADGEDITENLGFPILRCQNSLDFLKAYLNSKGMPTDFMTDDTSHVKDLYMNQRVYSYGIDECEEITYLEEKMDGIQITERDCSYQIKATEDGTDRIMYITVTVAGQDSNGATVVRYITYILEYDSSLSE